MAYTTDKKSTGLDVLTGLDAGDLHIVGDVSDSGRAKAITQNNLEIDIANSTNFVDTLVANNYFTTELAGDTNFITELQTAGISSLDVQENGVSVETPVETINFVAPAGTVTTPSAGVVDIDLISLMGGGGGGGQKLFIDTTEVSTTSATFQTAFSKTVPGGTLGTNDAIRFYIPVTIGSGTGSVELRVSYGGQTLGTIDPSAGSGITSIYGYIIADGATNAQKSQLFNQTLYDDEFTNALTVDSTVDQTLLVEIRNTAAGTAAITADAIVAERITDGGLQTKTVTLSNTDINSIYTTPITLIPAPGSGKVLQLSSILWSFEYGTIQYTGGGNIRVKEETTGTNLVAGLNDTSIKGTADYIQSDASPSSSSNVLTANKGILISNDTASFATGDGTLKVIIKYYTVTL